MSYFAKVLSGKVLQVISAEQEFFNTFIDSSPGEWIQTSYNTYGNQHPEGRPFRGNYAGVGFTYDKTNDVFIAPKPFESWILNESKWLWQAPISMPDNGGPYKWDEPSISWVGL